ncbi:MAG TPA: hypothetical protein VFM68_00240 [Candidatus Saccharimonadales bacterium]|nr:hypothetical protein [Candidatus Saccharimonadales bacterium]
MIERLGKNIIVNGDVLPRADYYEGMDEQDEAQIDRIISGINPAERAPEVPNDDAKYDSTALAQGVLFLLDKDMRPEAAQASIEQHPSAQNVETVEISELAQKIIQGYQEEVEQLRQRKARVDLSATKRAAFIATIRNLQRLSDADRQEIALNLGYSKDHFSRDLEPTVGEQERPRDWFERQYKDD